MRLIDLGQSKKAGVCFGNIVESFMPGSNKLEATYNTCVMVISECRTFSMELLLPNHASSYALLGAKYTPTIENGDLHLEIRYSEIVTENYESELAYNRTTIFKGLSKEYVKAVHNSTTEYFRSHDMPSGKIVFSIAACCKVRSSPLLFNIATKIVLSILMSREYPPSDEIIKAVCKHYLLERK